MKQKVFYCAIIFVVILAIPKNVWAYSFSATAPSGQTLYYSTLDANTVWLVTENSSAPYYSTYPTGALTIPATVTHNGYTYTVTRISHDVFHGCSGLSSVNIPNTITFIDYCAFEGCSNLTTISIPNSVTSIGNRAFYGCSSLTSATIGNSVTTIGDYAFDLCGGMTSVIIGSSVTSIGSFAFSLCQNLTSLTIPNSVTSIGEYAFLGCNGLSSITLGNNITTFGEGAFYNCSSLTSVTIPNSVTSISRVMFEGCTGLTSVTIPNSVTSIGSSAFSGCGNLTSVTIGSSVSTIGGSAFFNCNNLTEIISLAPVAPTLGNNSVFPGRLYYYATVHIPCGSLASYQLEWSGFRHLTEPLLYTINAQASNGTMGRVNITSMPDCENIVMEAIGSNGYHFTQWNDGNTNNPRSLRLTQDTSFIAYFSNQYTLTISCNNNALGTVSGSGTYTYLDTVEVSATAIEHHHFVRWSDGNTENPRRIIITENKTLTAYFAIDTHTVTVVSNDIARGMVEASGTEFVYGTPCTVTATVYTGYFFAGWSNGVNANPYTFAVLSDVELTALFAAEGEAIYTVTVVSANPVMGSVSGGGRALRGSTLTIRAIPNEGFQFLAWNDGNTENPRVVTVTKNITYTARFIRATQSISAIDHDDITIYSTDGRIVVQGAERMEMRVFDIVGHEVLHSPHSGETPVLPRGVYIVKVGTLPGRKVVVIR